MSRKIVADNQVTLTEEEKSLSRDVSGKLVITTIRDREMALLLQKNRLTYAAVLEENRVGSIYLGRVKNIVKEISACFVEIEGGEICFLPLKDVTTPFLINRSFDGHLKEGDLLPVQLTREPQKTKQASVTARISIATPYFSLALGSKRIGYSSKLTAEEKSALKISLETVAVSVNGELNQDLFQLTSVMQPQVGLIVRTQAKEFCDSEKSLSEALREAIDTWNNCLCQALHSSCYSCIYQGRQQIREYLEPEVTAACYAEIVTDQQEIYGKLCEEYSSSDVKIRYYQDASFSLEKLLALPGKLDEALSKRIWLKSGGYLVLEYTEAMTVIDVNSGKYEAKKGNTEKTAVLVNRQAAEEVALLLRLLNLSGIIIVDFINMEQEENNRELMQYLRELVQRDPIPTRVVDMTKLGLVEITRKKIRKTLREQMMLKG
ncbi:MAG: ribonuclease E/G [Acetatifactor sp.]